MFTQNLASHKEVVRHKTEQIDRLTDEIQMLSTRHKADLEALQELKDRVRIRTERQAKIANLKREIGKKRLEMQSRPRPPSTSDAASVHPAWLDQAVRLDVVALDPALAPLTPEQHHFVATQLPSTGVLRAYVNAYRANNAHLQRRAAVLKSRSTELEALYRKVVSLCTGVAEDKVEENLSALVAAVESEQGLLGEQEVGRVREFLRRVDGAAAVVPAQPVGALNPVLAAGGSIHE